MSSAITTLSRPFSHLPSPAHPRSHRQLGRYALAPLSLKKVQETSLADEAALYTGGLRTPPAEDSMSTAYQNPNAVLASTYDSHVALARQPSSLAHASRAGGAIYAAAMSQMSRSQSQQQQFHQQPTYQQQQNHYGQSLSSASRHSTRPSTPTSTNAGHARSDNALSKRDSSMVMHSLQLPSCISASGGSLDEFAALMTCFFWFESMETIEAAEQIRERRSSLPMPPLSSYTRPCAAYKKWVNSILSTTQVNQNVILLALLFIYRLKSTNPKVHGGPGSEYRLLTVALMLGNKFLDDNTYTNKTWAEVSGFAVKEIHVMEVEFLSNMRYDLLTSKEQWDEWLGKLACFHEYCRQAELAERAAEMTAMRQRAAAVPLSVGSPALQDYNSPLPSPTRVLPSSMQGSSSSLMTSYSPNSSMSSSSQTWPGSFQPTAASSPLVPRPDLCLPVPRKRSLEGSEVSEPAPKRITRQTSTSILAPVPRHPSSAADAVRLPVPHLTLNVPQASYAPTPEYSQTPVSLPPLDTGVRAMSTVYPNPTSWVSQVPVHATCGPQTPSYPALTGYGTPTKRHSPGGLAVFGSSPLTEAFSTHTPLSLSPSVYLQQRNSPYKPLRPVNTLNYPAPSIPLSEYHLGSAQMHYQPLGRRNVRTGVVPEFLPGHNSGRPLPAL